MKLSEVSQLFQWLLFEKYKQNYLDFVELIRKKLIRILFDLLDYLIYSFIWWQGKFFLALSLEWCFFPSEWSFKADLPIVDNWMQICILYMWHFLHSLLTWLSQIFNSRSSIFSQKNVCLLFVSFSDIL